jgi:mRNA interferase RelE/StbE
MTSDFQLKVSPAAKKFFKKMKDKALQQKFRDALKEIQLDPLIGERKKGDLAGVYGYDIYHTGTNYEIAYTFQEDKEGNAVLVILAGTREQFYQELKKYIKSSKIHKK